jgi:hypothetical protein
MASSLHDLSEEEEREEGHEQARQRPGLRRRTALGDEWPAAQIVGKFRLLTLSTLSKAVCATVGAGEIPLRELQPVLVVSGGNGLEDDLVSGTWSGRREDESNLGLITGVKHRALPPSCAFIVTKDTSCPARAEEIASMIPAGVPPYTKTSPARSVGAAVRAR